MHPWKIPCHFFSKAVDSSLKIRSQKLSITRLCSKFNKLELNFYKLLSFIMQRKSLFIHPHRCHGLNIFAKIEEAQNCACLGFQKMQTCWTWWWEYFFISACNQNILWDFNLQYPTMTKAKVSRRDVQVLGWYIKMNVKVFFYETFIPSWNRLNCLIKLRIFYLTFKLPFQDIFYTHAYWKLLMFKVGLSQRLVTRHFISKCQ